MKIKPFKDQILVEPFEKQQVLMADDGNLNEYGAVVAVGIDVMHIKVGDKIGFSVFGVEKLVIEDQKYYFIRESPEFLLAVIEDDISEE